MSETADGSEWGWFTETHDPREGPLETLLFCLETLLALGLIMRISAHVVASGIQHPDGHPFDVRYGLGLGWQVREPCPPWSDQIATAALLSTATLAWVVGAADRIELMPGLVAILGANLALLIGDPVWLLIQRYND
jgi:hypothetical protein